MSEYDQQQDWQDGEEIEIEAIGIEVSVQPIELYKVFKIANLVGGGGEAKHLIAEGYVAVNGELETRKRRKMYDGDFFEFDQEYYVVVCDAPVTEPEPKKETKLENKPAEVKSKNKQNKAENQRKAANSKNMDKKASQGKKSKAPKSAKQTKSNNTAVKKPKGKNELGRGGIDFF